jgi:sulfate adenylyltransferase
MIPAVTVGQGGEPMQVLFVCTANICRSAFAEVLARHLLGPDSSTVVASAGTYGLPAHPLNPDIGRFLPAGADAHGFASRPVTRGLVEGADLVLAMEAVHRQFLLEEYPASFRKVLTLGQFAEAAQQADGLRGRALLESVTRQRPPMRPEHDVADPYRRGREANQRAAAQIAGLLAVALPALRDAAE